MNDKNKLFKSKKYSLLLIKKYTTMLKIDNTTNIKDISK